MKRRVAEWSGVIFAHALLTCAPAHAGADADIVRKVEARAREHGFEGAILIGSRDGSERHVTIPSSVGANAIWRWASITKQLAAVLVMQEVERGRIDLEAPVARYWPDWTAPHAPRIRIRDLLLHNSGLPQPDTSVPDADGFPSFYRARASRPAQSAAGFCAGPPVAAPPARFEYNNCDSLVIAEVLRRVTGHSFERLLRDRFRRPLGLKTLGLFAFGQPARAHVRPTGEFSDKDALLNLGVNGAAAGAYGSIRDLWRFDRALLSGKLLAPATRETMWQSSRSNGFHGFFQWIYPAPLKGCASPVRIVERQGLVGGIELRNYLLPETGQALILFSRRRPTRLGDPWEGSGFAYDLLSIVACR